MVKSDTPRTDAIAEEALFSDETGSGYCEAVTATLSRQLERELTKALAERDAALSLVERLRNDLLNPPPDVQEKVVQMLNLVSADERDAWRAMADEFAEAYHEEELGPEPLVNALNKYERLKGGA